MAFHPNIPEVWESDWANKGNYSEVRGLWDAIDEIKFRYLREKISKNGFALEVGCGTARLLYFLANFGWQTVGFDFSPSALELARSRFVSKSLEIDLISGNAFNLPFRNRSFDLVSSTGLLEHFENPRSIVREMIRVLKPGGVFYSDIVPKKFSLLRSLDRFQINPLNNQKIIFERSFTRVEIIEMFEGLEIRDLCVVPAGIFLPRKFFPKILTFANRFEYTISKYFGMLTTIFDGTSVAELLGFYFIVLGTKI